MTENEIPKNPAVQSPEDRQHALDRKRYTVEKITLFFLFLYVTIAGFQWCEMRKATQATQIAAKAAKESADLTRKQMESVSAAVIEQRNGGIPFVFFHPPLSEVRFSLKNGGQVIAHDVRVRFIATVHNVSNPQSERPLVSGDRTIPVMRPTRDDASTPPDLTFPFDTSASQIKNIVDRGEEFIVIDGTLSYDNGFATTVTEPFCQAYLWTPGYGRQFPRCAEIKMTLKANANMKKK